RGFAVCSGGYGGVMEAASRGAKEAGGKTYGVTAEFFGRKVNQWVDVEVRKKTWEERLFELIRLADGFVACKGGTGTLVELAVVWEMLNKSVMARKPFAVLGDFWQPILERVREVEQGPRSSGAHCGDTGRGGQVPGQGMEARRVERMSRSAQAVLEFDKLRELLRLRTTCAPGRRHVGELEPGTNRVALESAFALIREGREWLRAERELGFGALADPAPWLDKLDAPGVVL